MLKILHGIWGQMHEMEEQFEAMQWDHRDKLESEVGCSIS